MRGMTFKKVLSLGGIFLLSTLLLVQLSWGCDDDDKGNPNCRDQWCWDHQGKRCHPPRIQSVDVDLVNKEIVIRGDNFDKGADPVVTLGGQEIEVLSHTGEEIVTTFEPGDFPDTDYRLVVSICPECRSKDKRRNDIGVDCKEKPPKDKCKCKCKCRCKDRYSLTIAGPPGPPSRITFARVSELVPLPGCAECARLIDGSAVCQSGVATGGGFSCPGCIPLYLSISVNEPLENLGGWHVVGTYSGGNSTDFTIYAICAQQ